MVRFRGPTKADKILVVDDDPSILGFIKTLLTNEGFEVAAASDGRVALELAEEFKPDVVLLDVMMPELDGLEVCRSLRERFMRTSIYIIILTARVTTADKVIGLRSGADDYVAKPFDPEELLERIRCGLRRMRDMAGLNPLTELPGNRLIEEAITRSIEDKRRFALMHVDIDNFKAFNDHYGVGRGDEAIELLAKVVEDSVMRADPEVAFAGHVGGDDLVAIVAPEEAEAIALTICRAWDRNVQGLYDDEDRARGYIELPDRRKEMQRFPVMSLSIGIASSACREFESHLDAGDVAAEMKQVAKDTPGSSYALDRRQSQDGAATTTHEAPKARTASDSRSVLIVDDDDDMRAVLRLHCQYMDLQVVAEARDGIEAFLQATQHRPAFVILDFQMPNMDGAEAARHIKELVPDAVIIAFSAHLEGQPDWADDFLDKSRIAEITPFLGRLLERAEGDSRSRVNRG